ITQCGPAYLYPIWCTVFLLFHLCWLGADIYWSVWGDQTDSLYGVRLTNWSVVLLLLYHVTDTTVAMFVFLKRKDIVLETTAGSIYKHGITSISVLLNLTFSAKPVRVWHLIHPVIFSIVYLVTTVIYQTATGTMIYPVLDWDSPGKAISVAFPFTFIGAPFLHLFAFSLYKFRVSICNRFCYTCSSETPVQRTGSLRSVVSEELSIPDDTNCPDDEQTTPRNGGIVRIDTSLSVHKFRISFRKDRRVNAMDNTDTTVNDCHVPHMIIT
ncbi:hypothetical protein FSP39_004223, partial [Pinctada imbricata]